MKQHNSSYMETEEKLFSAFLTLLQEKMPDKIKATDLIQASGIHKSTFYDHYEGGIKDYYLGLKHRSYEELRLVLHRFADLGDDVDLFHQLIEDINSLFPMDVRLELMSKPYFFIFLQDIEAYLIEQFASHNSQTGAAFWSTAASIRSAWWAFLGTIYYLFRHIDTMPDDEAHAILIQLTEQSRLLLDLSFYDAPEADSKEPSAFLGK